MKIQKFKLIETDMFPKYDLKVTLKPCFRCNHNCWFCNEYDNKTHMWTKDECDEVLHKLCRIPKDKRKIFFYFYGGEPTLTPHWEYLQFQLVRYFADCELFIQTQTNLSISEERLEAFLTEINRRKQRHHQVDICSSYHLGKQPVDTFIDKMRICDNYNALGLCFFSTEVIKEDQFIREFYQIVDCYPDKVKLKFTQLDGLADRNTIKGYETLLEDDYLKGHDEGESLEYRYFMRKYPEFKQYLEEGWNFEVDESTVNYSEVKERGIYRQFKYMKCKCGTKNIVIDHNLKVYHCNDYYYSQINPTDLAVVDFRKFLKSDITCLNHKCTDGLDHVKYR